MVDVELRDLPDFVVFIGKNSSGKSNLIDALALLFMEFGVEIDKDIGDIDSYQHLFPNHDSQASQPPEIAVNISLTAEEWAELLSVDQDTAQLFEASELRLVKRIVNVDGMLQWETYEVGTETLNIVRNGEEVDEEFKILGLLNRLGHLMSSGFSVIHTTENHRSWASKFEERPTIIEDGEVGRLWGLSQSKGNRRQTWTRVARQYTKIAPNEQRPVGVDSSIQMEEGTLSVPIGMTGEGSQAVLRLIGELERGSAIMAIEEPETHLHPTLIKKVGRLLTEATVRGKQLFICTHSPFLIDQSSLNSFFVVKNEGNGTQVSHMRDTYGLRNLLLDMGMRPSDILFSDAILIVEGLSDETFFDGLSNKIDVPLAERHVKIIRANGKSRGKYKIEFWAEVGRDAGIPLYLIFDKGAQEEADRAITQEQIPRANCLILDKGDLEDYYPWPILKEALSKQFGIEVEELIPSGGRVAELKKLFRKKAQGNTWKPMLAEEIVQIITREAAESELEEVVSFLRKIYAEVGAD